MPKHSAKSKLKRIAIKKRTIPAKLNPQTSTFAKILLVLRQNEILLEENEFKFLLNIAIQTVHGDIANEPDVLSFSSIDLHNYRAIIRFKTVHYTRVLTSLLLFGNWRGTDIRFDIEKTAQSPIFLSF